MVMSHSSIRFAWSSLWHKEMKFRKHRHIREVNVPVLTLQARNRDLWLNAIRYRLGYLSVDEVQTDIAFALAVYFGSASTLQWLKHHREKQFIPWLTQCQQYVVGWTCIERPTVKAVDLEVIKWLDQHVCMSEFSKHDLLRSCCYKGKLLLAMWFHDKLSFTAEEVRLNKCKPLRLSCKGGHVDMAKWLHRRFGLTADDARLHRNFSLRSACSNGHLDTVRWLCNTFDLTVQDVRTDHNYSFRRACNYGHLKIAQFLFQRFSLTPEDVCCLNNAAFHGACKAGHIAIVEWLIENINLGLTKGDVVGYQESPFAMIRELMRSQIAALEQHNVGNGSDIVVSRMWSVPPVRRSLQS